MNFLDELRRLAPALPPAAEKWNEFEQHAFTRGFIPVRREQPLASLDGAKDDLLVLMREWDLSDVEIAFTQFFDQPVCEGDERWFFAWENKLPLMLNGEGGEIFLIIEGPMPISAGVPAA